MGEVPVEEERPRSAVREIQIIWIGQPGRQAGRNPALKDRGRENPDHRVGIAARLARLQCVEKAGPRISPT